MIIQEENTEEIMMDTIKDEDPADEGLDGKYYIKANNSTIQRMISTYMMLDGILIGYIVFLSAHSRHSKYKCT